MSIKPEATKQTQNPPDTPEIYDDSVEAYIARRDAWLADQASAGG